MALSNKKIYYRRGGITYAVSLYTTLGEIGNPSNKLVLYNGGLLYPAVLNGTESHLRFRQNGVTTTVRNSAVPLVAVIPAGTYTYKAFVQLVLPFIANNAKRMFVSPVTLVLYNSSIVTYGFGRADTSSTSSFTAPLLRVLNSAGIEISGVYVIDSVNDTSVKLTVPAGGITFI